MSSPTALRGLVARLYEIDFPAAQSVWVEGLLVLLIELRRAFANDLDKVIILSIIGQQMLRDPTMQTMSHTDARRRPIRDWRGRNTNIDALARTSGIPRESVRRKTNALIADGLVKRVESGGLVIGPGTAAELSPITTVVIEMIDTLMDKYFSMMLEKKLLPANPASSAAD